MHQVAISRISYASHWDRWKEKNDGDVWQDTVSNKIKLEYINSGVRFLVGEMRQSLFLGTTKLICVGQLDACSYYSELT